jgi:hypothetical protein
MAKENIITPEVYHLIKVLNKVLIDFKTDRLVSVDANLYYEEDSGNIRLEFKYVQHTAKKPADEVFSMIFKVDPYKFFSQDTSIREDINNKFFTQILFHSDFTN